MIHDSFRVIDMSGGILNQFPFLRYIAPNVTGYRPLINALTPIWTFLREVIADTKKSLEHAELRSLIEAFLVEIEKTTSDSNSTFTGLTFCKSNNIYF